MFFSDMKLNVNGVLDTTTPEGRAKLKEIISERLKNAPSEKQASIGRLVEAMFGIADELPADFAVVHELNQEAKSMEEAIGKRQVQLRAMTKRYTDRDVVNCLGCVDSFLTVIGGAFASVSTYCGYLEKRVIELEAAPEEGPSGRESPTEPPPAPVAEPPMAPEASTERH